MGPAETGRWVGRGSGVQGRLCQLSKHVMPEPLLSSTSSDITLTLAKVGVFSPQSLANLTQG